jgi:hypothetical protein
MNRRPSWSMLPLTFGSNVFVPTTIETITDGVW